MVRYAYIGPPAFVTTITTIYFNASASKTPLSKIAVQELALIIFIKNNIN